MARWTIGEAEVETLLAGGELQKLFGDAANGERLLAKASTTVATARSAIETDPDSAFVLAMTPPGRRSVRPGLPPVRCTAASPQRAGVPGAPR